MATDLALINGLPGSGKSTLGAALAPLLDATLLSKDDLKSSLLAVAPRLPAAQLGALAMDTIWSIAADLPGAVLVESWWFRPRDVEFAATGLRRVAAQRVVEVWCDLPPPVAERRYRARVRAGHFEDARHLRDDWVDWAERAEPLALSDVLRVRTEAAVDVLSVAETIRRAWAAE